MCDPIYTLIEYTDNYAKTRRSFWQYCRDKPEDDITNSKFKVNITGKSLLVLTARMLKQRYH